MWRVVYRCGPALAAATFINGWLVEHQLDPDEVAVVRLAEALGTADFAVRGQTITALAQPHLFYLPQKLQDTLAALSEEAQLGVSETISEAGMSAVLSTALTRRIVHSDNLEVWN